MNTRLLLPLILLLLTATGAGAQGMMYCDNSRQGFPLPRTLMWCACKAAT